MLLTTRMTNTNTCAYTWQYTNTCVYIQEWCEKNWSHLHWDDFRKFWSVIQGWNVGHMVFHSYSCVKQMCSKSNHGQPSIDWLIASDWRLKITPPPSKKHTHRSPYMYSIVQLIIDDIQFHQCCPPCHLEHGQPTLQCGCAVPLDCICHQSLVLGSLKVRARLLMEHRPPRESVWCIIDWNVMLQLAWAGRVRLARHWLVIIYC